MGIDFLRTFSDICVIIAVRRSMKQIFLIVGICMYALVWSQPTQSPASYTEHQVEAGQTLYSISKLYNLTVDQLLIENPGADAGISVGQKLRIPKAKGTIANTGKYLVKSGDTMYGISRSYGISVDELKSLNNGMPAGLITGDSIVVPSGSITQGTPGVRAVPQTDDVYDIAVMLPFYSSVKDSLASREFRLREASIAMYRGIMAAADSLKAAGLKARIRVLDVTENKGAIHAVLKRKDMEGVDLVIGPLFKDAIPEVAAWCSANGAQMVVPVQQPNRVLLNAPALSKSVAGSVTQWMSIARYALKKFNKENIVLIDSKILDDRKMIDSFKEEWFRINKDSLQKIVVCDDLANLKIAQLLPSGKCLVVVPTNDKKVISAVFRAIGTRTDIDVLGTESWDDMESITTEMRNKFHVSFPKQIYASEDRITVKRWQDNYRKKFKTEPIDFSYTGYDVTYYFGMALLKFGPAFTNQWADFKPTTIGTQFEFFRTSTDNGFENSAINIVRTDNYKLSRAN
jgi:LysM repeat protein/ABC-type branched-subunit amino acid transport system substrate-binding protein